MYIKCGIINIFVVGSNWEGRIRNYETSTYNMGQQDEMVGMCVSNYFCYE
jgi:hypothetical protein